MAHESLKNSISSVIKTNGNQEITGAILQNILLSVVNNLGDGATFKGVATTSTYASTTFDNVFYIAVEKGTYPSFSSSVDASDGLVVFSYSGGSWLKTNIAIATKSDLTPLATKSEVTSGLATKQDTISDLATIRSGAAKGATSLQQTDAEANYQPKITDSNKLSFSLIKDKPTTLSGYGITDAPTKTDVANTYVAKTDFFDYFWYGVEWDTTISTPSCTRIGNVNLHKTLPIQSKMRRCLLLDNGSVNYYLSATDSTKKVDGTAANLTGVDGQVMVEIPKHFRKFETNGTKLRCLLSEYPLVGYHEVPKIYISAYEAALDRTITATPKLSSVVNTTASFRGGNNTTAWDGTYRSLLGKPVSNVSLIDFRTYARNRGAVNWNCYTYDAHKTMYWLYIVEYANFNSQLPFNAQSTSEGYKQGGLGNGVTDLDGTKWNTFNLQNPFIPCGYTNSVGNNTGVVAYSMPSEYDTTTKTTYIPTYRGVENAFGHVFKWTDGCKCNIQSDASGGLSEFYVCDEPANFTSSGTTNYQLRGNVPRVEGYVKEVILGEYGEIMPLSVGGGSTTYFCDLFYTSKPASGIDERGVLFGGSALSGATAGFVSAISLYAPSFVRASLGSRLCYLPLK